MTMDNLPIIALALGNTIFIPSTVLVGTLVIGVLLLWSPLQHVARWVITITSITLLIAALGPLSVWVARPLELRFPQSRQLPVSVTGIILLGGAFEQDLTAEWNQPQLNEHAER